MVSGLYVGACADIRAQPVSARALDACSSAAGGSLCLRWCVGGVVTPVLASCVLALREGEENTLLQFKDRIKYFKNA